MWMWQLPKVLRMCLLFIPLDPLITPPRLIRETWKMFLVRENLSVHWPFYSICLYLWTERTDVAQARSNLHVGVTTWLSPTQAKNSLLSFSWSEDWDSETEEDEVEVLSHLLPNISRVASPVAQETQILVILTFQIISA